MKKGTMFMVLTALVVGGLMAGKASALVYDLGVGPGGTATDYILGEVIPGDTSVSGLEARDQLMINTLLGMGLGERSPSGVVTEYYRSTTDYGTLPAAVLAGDVLKGSIGQMTALDREIEIVLPSTMTYQYLVGAWDGPNGGAQVWYIGNIAAGSTIWIPRYAHPEPSSGKHPESVWPQNLVETAAPSDQYQITTWTMFNPTNVPDGGMTVGLLGMAIAAMGIVARKLR